MYKALTANLTTTAGGDLIEALEALLSSGDNIIAAKISIVAQSALSIKINDHPVYSPLYANGTDWKISYDKGDVFASSIVTQQTGVSVWISILY